MMAASANELSLKEKVLVESGHPTNPGCPVLFYRLRVDEIQKPASSPFRCYEYGKPRDGTKRFEKVILIVGATGAGKTTLINSLINYMFGVEFGDTFRLKLISETTHGNQALSQTQLISAYTLHNQDGFKIPYTLTIIDTPGYGDTEGIQRDQEITKQMHALFKSDIDIVDHIDAVGFVACAGTPRLTDTQQYIFDSILSLFGKDIGENIFLLLTFADSYKPKVLAAVKEAAIPYQKYFKFNNSAVLPENASGTADPDDNDDSDDSDIVNKVFYETAMNSFQKFAKALEHIPAKSLKLTKEVLEKRQNIEIYIDIMNKKVRESLIKLKQVRREEELLVNLKENPGNKEQNVVSYEIEEVVECHDVVTDNFLEKMAKGILTVATLTLVSIPPNYATEIKKRKKTVNASQVIARHSGGEQMTVEQAITASKAELEAIQKDVLHAIGKIRDSLNILNKIALRNNIMSTVKYIDILILNARANGGEGWQDREEELKQIKKRVEQLQEMSTEDYDPSTMMPHLQIKS